MVKVLIKKLSSDVKLPSYKTSGASGMDLMAYIKSPITIKPKTSELISTGLSVAFSGELKVIIYNHGNQDFIVNNNDRIAQMILTPVIKMELQETNELPESVRGEGGFGSTGK